MGSFNLGQPSTIHTRFVFIKHYSENDLLKTSLESAKTENESLKTEKQRLLSQIESQEAKDFNEIEKMLSKIETLLFENNRKFGLAQKGFTDRVEH